MSLSARHFGKYRQEPRRYEDSADRVYRKRKREEGGKRRRKWQPGMRENDK